MEDPPALKPPASRSGRPTRAEPPEDCPVKDRCRRARAQVCLDCGEAQKQRRGRRKTTVTPSPPPCPTDPQ